MMPTKTIIGRSAAGRSRWRWVLIAAMLTAVAFSPSTLAADPASPKTMYVGFGEGARLRAGPSESAVVVATLPYGAKVTVLKTTSVDFRIPLLYADDQDVTGDAAKDADGALFVLEGRWASVTQGDQKGYVFDGLLTPLPPIERKVLPEKCISGQCPEQKHFGCEEWGSYVETHFGSWKPSGSFHKKLPNGEGCGDGCEDSKEGHRFGNGMELIESRSGICSSTTWRLPGITVAQGLLLMHACSLIDRRAGNRTFDADTISFGSADDIGGGYELRRETRRGRKPGIVIRYEYCD